MLPTSARTAEIIMVVVCAHPGGVYDCPKVEICEPSSAVPRDRSAYDAQKQQERQHYDDSAGVQLPGHQVHQDCEKYL